MTGPAVRLADRGPCFHLRVVTSIPSASQSALVLHCRCGIRVAVDGSTVRQYLTLDGLTLAFSSEAEPAPAAPAVSAAPAAVPRARAGGAKAIIAAAEAVSEIVFRYLTMEIPLVPPLATDAHGSSRERLFRHKLRATVLLH